MTPLTTSNFPPNEGSFDLPPTRLDELLADRATAGLSDAEEIELTRLLAAAGTTDDISIDLAAAAVACASVPEARSIALPDSLVHALDREAEAWCAGVGSHRVEPARVHGSSLRSEVGRGHALRTPYKRFTREYGGWLAAAACLAFGIYTLTTSPGSRVAPSRGDTAVFGGPIARPIETITRPIEDMALGLRQRAVERINRWFNHGDSPEIVTLGSATPDASPDVAVGEVLWNADEGNGVLRIKGLEGARGAVDRTFRVNVVCAKTGKRVPIETGTVTLHPGQKDVLVPLDSPAGAKEALHNPGAFVVSVCSSGPMGVAQSEGIVGIGGTVENLGQAAEPDGG